MILSQEPERLRPGRLAFVGVDGHIYVQRADDSGAFRLTWSVRDLSYGVWNRDDAVDRIRYFWPTWSPRGDRLACLGTYGQGGQEQGTGVYVLDALEQVESWEIWTGASSSPIYLSWAPDGERLAFVLQQHEALSLALADLEQPGESMPLLTGLPLFHRFSPDGRSLAVHLGGRFNGEPGRRLYHLDLTTPDRRLTLSEKPGEFGTPTWSPDGKHLAFAIEEEGAQTLYLVEHVRGARRKLGQFTGIGALLWAQDGSALLVAVTKNEERTGFEELWSYPLEGQPRKLIDEPFMACFNACDDNLVYVTPGPPERAATWKTLEPDGVIRTLHTFFPSQPQRFMLHFFHQYNQSHRLLSPDGRHIAFSGYRTRAEMEDDHTLPRIYVLPVDGSREASVVADGSIVCWAPEEPGIGSS